jgi:hypothetical protein
MLCRISGYTVVEALVNLRCARTANSMPARRLGCQDYPIRPAAGYSLPDEHHAR